MTATLSLPTPAPLAAQPRKWKPSTEDGFLVMEMRIEARNISSTDPNLLTDLVERGQLLLTKMAKQVRLAARRHDLRRTVEAILEGIGLNGSLEEALDDLRSLVATLRGGDHGS